MDEQKKPFDTVSIVFLLIVSSISDIADFVTALVFLVPVIGQVIFASNSFIISPVVWAIIQLSFIIKTGMGRASLVAAAGGLGNVANVPGSETITTVVAIIIANNAQMLIAISPMAGIAAKGGVAAEKKIAGAAKAGAVKEKAAAEAKGAGRAPRQRGEMEETAGEAGPEKPPAPKGREVLPEELGEMKSPFEELQELMKKTPAEKHVSVDDEKNEVDLRKTK